MAILLIFYVIFLSQTDISLSNFIFFTKKTPINLPDYNENNDTHNC